MAFTYIIRYSFSDKKREWRNQAVSPVSALNAFHTDMQKTRDVSSDRKTETRPRLKPHQYAILEMAQIYADGKGLATEGKYDLPHTPNPDLLKGRPEDPEPMDFPFLASTPVKERNE